MDLQNSHDKVIDLAMKYGYDKPDSDTEGFKTAQIPRATWAVFRSEKIDYMGSAMKELFDRAYQEWLATADNIDTKDLILSVGTRLDYMSL